MNALLIVIFIVIFEAVLFIVVNWQRKSFSWLITESDEVPLLDPKAIRSFINYSFDPNLGWVRKPNSIGREEGKDGPIVFHINAAGARATNKDRPPLIAAFGDSYVFCRQVEDSETWEEYLSDVINCGVLNFGVGNYGADQALLRYEQSVLSESIEIVILGFVPETICRIQSYWKHYLEFGNTFAFKPRFVLNKQRQLVLLENQIRNEDDFFHFKKKLPIIQASDYFYVTKFRSYQFRFPYTLSLLRHPIRQTRLIAACALRAIFRKLNISSKTIEDLPFATVMHNNISDSYLIYGDDKSTMLLSAILERFRSEAVRRSHMPLVIVFPQLIDLKMNKANNVPYQQFFSNVGQKISVIDLTEKFMNADFEKLYTNDMYGGHLSIEGNRLVAEEVATWLKLNNKLTTL